MATPETCPVCGADLPRKAKACPECGSDESTGWSERATTQSLGLPDDEFDYDEFVQEEFGRPRRRHISPFWWVVAIVLLAVLLLLWFGR